MAQEVVVLPRDESQLAEENAIVLDHLVERLFAAHEVFELRRAEHGSQHGPAGDVDGLPGEALLGRHAALSHGGLRGDKLGEVRGHERVHLLEVRGAEEVLVGSAAEAHGDDGVDAAELPVALVVNRGDVLEVRGKLLSLLAHGVDPGADVILGVGHPAV